MRIKLRDNDCTEVWDGVYYKKLSNYPHITDWEIKNLLDFMRYEARYGRDCPIECDDPNVIAKIQEAMTHPEAYQTVKRPSLLTECTACPQRKGCETAFVCHTTSVENAKKILQSGKLLSAVKARGVPVEELVREERNAAHDPADFFEYIMFAWGNCQAGDRLVMERKLGRSPTERELSVDFTPGIRFYFRYDTLISHPNAISDGFLPLKVKDELILTDWLDTMIVPETYRAEIEPLLPEDLTTRTVYVEKKDEDLWTWAEKVYRVIEDRANIARLE